MFSSDTWNWHYIWIHSEAAILVNPIICFLLRLLAFMIGLIFFSVYSLHCWIMAHSGFNANGFSSTNINIIVNNSVIFRYVPVTKIEKETFVRLMQPIIIQMGLTVMICMRMWMNGSMPNRLGIYLLYYNFSSQTVFHVTTYRTVAVAATNSRENHPLNTDEMFRVTQQTRRYPR